MRFTLFFCLYSDFAPIRFYVLQRALERETDDKRYVGVILEGVSFQLMMRSKCKYPTSPWIATVVSAITEKNADSGIPEKMWKSYRIAEHLLGIKHDESGATLTESSYNIDVTRIIIDFLLRIDMPEEEPGTNDMEFCWYLLSQLFVYGILGHFISCLGTYSLIALTKNSTNEKLVSRKLRCSAMVSCSFILFNEVIRKTSTLLENVCQAYYQSHRRRDSTDLDKDIQDHLICEQMLDVLNFGFRRYLTSGGYINKMMLQNEMNEAIKQNCSSETESTSPGLQLFPHCKMLMRLSDSMLVSGVSFYKEDTESTELLLETLIRSFESAIDCLHSLSFNVPGMFDAILKRVEFTVLHSISTVSKHNTQPIPGVIRRCEENSSISYLDQLELIRRLVTLLCSVGYTLDETTGNSIVGLCALVEKQTCLHDSLSLPRKHPGLISKLFDRMRNESSDRGLRFLHYLAESFSASTYTRGTDWTSTLCRKPGRIHIDELVETYFFGDEQDYSYSIDDVSIMMLSCHFHDCFETRENGECFFKQDRFQKLCVVLPSCEKNSETTAVAFVTGYYNSEKLFPFLADEGLLTSTGKDRLLHWTLCYLLLAKLFEKVISLIYWDSDVEKQYLMIGKLATNSSIRSVIVSWLRCLASFSKCKEMVESSGSDTKAEQPKFFVQQETKFTHREKDLGATVDSTITDVSERRRRKRIEHRQRNIQRGRIFEYENEASESDEDISGSQKDEVLPNNLTSQPQSSNHMQGCTSEPGFTPDYECLVPYLRLVEYSLIQGVSSQVLVCCLKWCSYISNLRSAEVENDEQDMWSYRATMETQSGFIPTVSLVQGTDVHSLFTRCKESTLSTEDAQILDALLSEKMSDLTQIEAFDWIQAVYILLRQFYVTLVPHSTLLGEYSSVWERISLLPPLPTMKENSSSIRIQSLRERFPRLCMLERTCSSREIVKGTYTCELKTLRSIVPWLVIQCEPLLELLSASREEESQRLAKVLQDTPGFREQEARIENMKKKKRRTELMGSIELAKKQGTDYEFKGDDVDYDFYNNAPVSNQAGCGDGGGISPHVLECLLIGHTRMIQHALQCTFLQEKMRDLLGNNITGSTDGHDTYGELLDSLIICCDGVNAKVDYSARLSEAHRVQVNDPNQDHSSSASRMPTSLASTANGSADFVDPESSHAYWQHLGTRSTSAKIDDWGEMSTRWAPNSSQSFSDRSTISLNDNHYPSSLSRDNEVPVVKPKTTYAHMGTSVEEQMLGRVPHTSSSNMEIETRISVEEPKSFWIALLLDNVPSLESLLQRIPQNFGRNNAEKLDLAISMIRKLATSVPLHHAHAALSLMDLVVNLRIAGQGITDVQLSDKSFAATLFELGGSPLTVPLGYPFGRLEKLEATYDLKLRNLPFFPVMCGDLLLHRSQQRFIIESIMKPDDGKEVSSIPQQLQQTIVHRKDELDLLWGGGLSLRNRNFSIRRNYASWACLFIPSAIPPALRELPSTRPEDDWINFFLTRPTNNFIFSGGPGMSKRMPTSPSCASSVIFSGEGVSSIEWTVHSGKTSDDFDLWETKYALCSSLSLTQPLTRTLTLIGVGHALAVSLNARCWEESIPLQVPPPGQASKQRDWTIRSLDTPLGHFSSCLHSNEGEFPLFHWCRMVDYWEVQLEILLRVTWVASAKAESTIYSPSFTTDDVIVNSILGIGEKADSCLGHIIQYGLHNHALSSLNGPEGAGIVSSMLHEGYFPHLRRYLSLLQCLYAMAVTHIHCSQSSDSKFGNHLIQITETWVDSLVKIFQKHREACRTQNYSLTLLRPALKSMSDVLTIIQDMCDEILSEEGACIYSCEESRLRNLTNHCVKLYEQVANMIIQDEEEEIGSASDCNVPFWRKISCIPVYKDADIAPPDIRTTLPQVGKTAISQLGGCLISREKLSHEQLRILKWRRLLPVPNVFDPFGAGRPLIQEVAQIEAYGRISSICDTPLGRILL